MLNAGKIFRAPRNEIKSASRWRNKATARFDLASKPWPLCDSVTDETESREL